MKSLNLRSRIGGTAVVLMLSLAASCTDNELLRHDTPTDGIAFTPSIATGSRNADKSAQTRATAPVTRHSVTTLRNAQGGRTLYLHTTETDSIATPAATDAEHIATRGAVVTTTTFEEQYGGFGVLAYAYQGEWDGTQTPNYIYNEKATADGGTYGFNPPRFWPGEAYNMAFFAYAPHDETGSIFGKNTGAPTLTYSVPTDITKQKDLLAYWETGVKGDKRSTMSLRFSHLCTAVKFKVGAGLENAITSIAIKNVYGSGTYSAADSKWTTSGKAEGTYTLAIANSENTPQETELTTGENTFMMIPQTLPDGAEIEVKYKDEDGREQTLTASISDKKEWMKGYTVVYKISYSPEVIEYTFEMPTESIEFTYDGKLRDENDKGQFQIQSYKQITKNNVVRNEPAAWTAEFSTDGGKTWSAKPDWLSTFTANGNGSTNLTSYEVGISKQVSTTQTNPHDAALKKATSVSGTYNLSNNTGGTEVQNTANCYVINAPGKYSLPLVYGNAIKNGQDNQSSYTSNLQNGDYVLKTFKNYIGDDIQKPYIYEDKDIQIKDAVLLWQDRQNLVQNIALSQDKKDLIFEVPQASIGQGNAVVAIRDNNQKIIWSWHIWVTDFVPGKDAAVVSRFNPLESQNDQRVTNHQNRTYTFMGLNIGWCFEDLVKYEAREVKVRFRQEGSGQTKDMTIKQLERVEAYGYQPYFQFGRKDPMKPGSNKDGKDKDCYYGAGYSHTTEQESDAMTLGSYIQNPCIFYTGLDNYVDVTLGETFFYNLWNANNSSSEANDNTIVKTIYDPSPVGYCVPPSNAFTGVTCNGQEVRWDNTPYPANQVNSPYEYSSDTNVGWEIYCNKMDNNTHDATGGVIYYPATGARNYQSGALTYVNMNGYYWTVTPYNKPNEAPVEARCLRFGSVYINPLGNFSHAYGFPVRPVKEANR